MFPRRNRRSVKRGVQWAVGEALESRMLLSAAPAHVVSPDAIEHRDAVSANITASFSYSGNPTSNTSILQIISVTYADQTPTALITESSLPTSLEVTNPSGGYDQLATAQTPPGNQPGNSFTINYDANAPGGFPVGSYTVTVPAGQITDDYGDSNAQMTSTFTVASGVVSGTAPTATVTAPNVTSETQSESVTVTYSSTSSAISGSTVAPGNITVTDGAETLTVAGASYQQSGNNIVAIYNLMPSNPSGWQSSDNGTYTVTVNANAVSDGVNQGNAAATGTFSIQVVPMTPPTTSIFVSAPLITNPQQPQVIDVTYSSAGGIIDPSTIAASNISVVGPHGNPVSVMLLNVDPPGSTVVASYAVVNPDPNQYWQKYDNGTYSISVNTGAVSDNNGNASAQTTGSFTVLVGDVTSPIAAVSSTPGMIQAPTDSEAITVVYAAATALNQSNISASNVAVTGPGGQALSVTKGAVVGSGNQIAVTYYVVPPDIGGQWHAADNGTYSVSVVAGVVTDANNAPNPPSAGVGFSVAIPSVTSETPAITAPTVTSNTQQATVTVTFGSLTGSLNTSVINPSNITVTSPGGKKLNLAIKSEYTNGPSVVGVYVVTPPSGIWLQSDNGTYHISAAPGAVKDSLGNGNTAGFGTMKVAVPAITAPVDVISAPNLTGFGQAFEIFTVVYASSTKIVAPATNTPNVGVYTPSNVLLNTSIIGESGGGTNALTLVYATAAPSGAWLITDNGTYTIKVAANTVLDTNGRSNPAAQTSFRVIVPMGGPPTAMIIAPPVTAQGSATQTITVIYAATLAPIDTTTITGSNISVTGPGPNLSATSVQTSTNGDTTTAIYTVAAPNGSWQPADDGTYTVTVLAGSVKDLDGNPVAVTTQTFNVNVAVEISATVVSSNLYPHVGDAVTYKAVVISNIGGPVPTGTVTFRTGQTVLGMGIVQGDGSATLTVAAATQGNSVVTIDYSGDSIYPAATSVASLHESTSQQSALSASLVGALPPFFLPGQKTKIAQTIELKNTPAATFSDILNFAFYLSTGTTIDSSAIELPGSFEKRLKLGGKKQIGLHQFFNQLSPAISVGTYHLIVQITDTTGATSVAASQQTFRVTSATIDFTGSFAKVPTTAKAARAGVVLNVSNLGSVTASGSLGIVIYASTTNTFDQNTPVALRTAHPVNLKPGGKPQAIHLTGLVLPSTPGAYYLIAVLDPNNSSGDVNPANNIIVSASQVMVV